MMEQDLHKEFMGDGNVTMKLSNLETNLALHLEKKGIEEVVEQVDFYVFVICA